MVHCSRVLQCCCSCVFFVGGFCGSRLEDLKIHKDSTVYPLPAVQKTTINNIHVFSQTLFFLAFEKGLPTFAS